jgi:membrane protease subunit (stomatin/prohibitin family)
MPEFYVENISLPPEVEKALDARTSRGIAGNLDDHMKWRAAEAMNASGSAAGAAMATGMGAGMGISMGHQMGPWGAMQSPAPAPQAAPIAPPPPPVEHVWHIAENGATKGPFSKASLGRMVTEGALTRETFVWTQGQDGWKKAEEVTELAQLFTVLPPPPPPGV